MKMIHALHCCLPVFSAAALLLTSCASPMDGIDAPAGTPSVRLVFAQGVLKTAIPGAQAVQPVKINGRTPSLLRWDHNEFSVPAGPVMVVVQGFGTGTSASAAVQFNGKPGETYRFGHQPSAGGETTFIVLDSKDNVIGTSRKTFEARPYQTPMHMPQLD